MEEKKEKKFIIKNYFGVLVLPILLCVLEYLFKITDGIEISTSHILGTVLSCFSIGMLFNIFLVISKSEKLNRTLLIIFSEIFTVIFLIMFFMDDAYTTLMNIEAMVNGAGDVVSDFKDTLIQIVTGGVKYIAIYHIPVILIFIFRKKICKLKRDKMWKGFFTLFLTIVLVVLFGASTYFVQTSNEIDSRSYKYNYDFDQAARTFGILTTLRLDIKYMIFEQPTEVVKNALTLENSRGITYGAYDSNKLNIDFDYLSTLTKDQALINAYSVLKNDEGTKKNMYTGMFEGKNLIIITAESFTKELISEELTPTLYRLYTKGIQIDEYYQPAWGGSTSTGEYSIMTGLIPTSGVSSIKRTQNNDMWTTIGNELIEEGYSSFAFHNHNYRYYGRQLTHVNLGYRTYMGYGNGLEKYITYTWPESDLELMEATVPKYINEEHFSIYYMTVSGHPNYGKEGNAMVRKNWDKVKNLKLSEPLKGYLACNLELEAGMKYLVESLEKAGKLDDTVIVLSTDHYPYGLNSSSTWGTDINYLKEWYGLTKSMTTLDRDHNSLILYCGSLEGQIEVTDEEGNVTLVDKEPIHITGPVESLDIQPTLLNLFGIDYDSRLFAGRDIFSKSDAIVMWSNHDWYTEKGYYHASSGKFDSKDGTEVSQDYIDRINAYVSNKFTVSKAVLSSDLLGKVRKGIRE